MQNPKIFFIPGSFPFCYYFRGYLPGVYSNNIVVPDFFRKDFDISGENLIEKANRADVIVFQRPTTRNSYDLAVLLKQKGKKIIFENDDTYSGIPLIRLGNENRRKIAREMRDTLNDFLRIADGAIASTKILAEEFSMHNKNVVVLKNTIDPLDEYPKKKNTTGKFRIGIIGSVSSNDDYIHIKECLQKLDARGDITFVVLGVKFPDGKIMPSMQEDHDFWASLKNIEWHPVVHVTEYMQYVARLALDLAIIPRKDHYFNKCKSNLKFLEMSLLGIPVVAQGFEDGSSPYQGVDEKYMTVIVDNDKWHDIIIDVKDNYVTYSNLADQAKQYVLRDYNIRSYAHVWVDEIKKLINNK